MLDAENEPRGAGVLWVMHLDWPAPPDVTPRLPAQFMRLQAEAAGSLAQAMGHDDPAAVLERLAAGRRCYVAEVSGHIAAYGWVSFGEEWIGEMRLRIRLEPGEAYIWDCVTLPAFRRRRLYTALLAYIADELRAEELCRVWIGADMDNVISQRGLAGAGFKPVADLVVERVLTLRHIWVRGRPGVPDAVVAQARRALLGERDRFWLSALCNLS